MSWKTLRKATILTALVGITFLVGCAPKEPAPTPTQPVESAPEPAGGVLRIGAVYDFKQAIEGRYLIFDTLVGLDETGEPLPRLAESWQATDDDMAYTFHLRKGVKFHDGTPLNAETAKFALGWLINNARWGKYADSIEIVDEYTVRLRLKEFYYPLLTDLGYEGNGKIVSPRSVEPEGDVAGMLVDYVGTGPFKLAEYRKDQKAVLVRNEEYWGEKPNVGEVIWNTIPDANTQIMALQAGELDIIGAAEHHASVPYVRLPELKTDPDLVVTSHSYGRYQVIRLNVNREPFTSKKVRQAINFAIDRETMVRSLFGDVTEPAILVMASWFKYGPNNVDEGYTYDPGMATHLLMEAGWEDTDNDGVLDKDGKPFIFDLTVPAGEANADAVAPIVQAELKKVGIQMNIVTVESNTAWDKKEKGEFDAFMHHSGNIPWAPAGLLQQEHLSTAGGFKHYASEELDRLIERAFTTRNERERRAAYDQIWEILQEEAVCVPLYDIVKVVIYREDLQDFEFPPIMYQSGLERCHIGQP